MARKATTRRRGVRKGRANRKKHEARVGFPSPLAALLVVVALLSLVYLWLCGRCEGLGKDLARLERQKEELVARVMNEEYKWTQSKAPANMERLLAHHKLVMILPPERDVVRVRRAQLPLEVAEQQVTGRQYAQRRGTFVHD
jgi:hypothetical protein